MDLTNQTFVQSVLNLLQSSGTGALGPGGQYDPNTGPDITQQQAVPTGVQPGQDFAMQSQGMYGANPGAGNFGISNLFGGFDSQHQQQANSGNNHDFSGQGRPTALPSPWSSLGNILGQQ